MKIYLPLKDKNGEVIKTLETSTTELSTGLVKRLCKTIRMDDIVKKGMTAEELYPEVMSRVIACYDLFEEFIIEIFSRDGLTAEQLDDMTTPADVANVILALITLTLISLQDVGKDLKKLVATAVVSD